MHSAAKTKAAFTAIASGKTYWYSPIMFPWFQHTQGMPEFKLKTATIRTTFSQLRSVISCKKDNRLLQVKLRLEKVVKKMQRR